MSTDIQRVAQAFDDAADILELNYLGEGTWRT